MKRSLIDILDFSVEEIEELLAVAKDMIVDPDKYAECCKRKKLATLFFEPSTRTRLSFEAAMLELGGSVIGFSDAANTSSSKGESVSDTAKVMSCYADIIAMRHPKEGAPLVAANAASIPVINAGDGGHNHPTQTLADLLTISREKGRIDNFTIGFCGDLKFGRTVHSLISALSRYSNVKVVLVSPYELKLPSYVKKDILDKKNIEYVETTDLEAVMPELDVLYMTRVQKERFFNEEEYLRLKDSYVLTPEKIAKDWDGFYQVSDKGSAYSTMAWLSNGELGFVMEEETHCTTAGGGYTIVFDSFSIDELTDGAYIYDSKRR